MKESSIVCLLRAPDVELVDFAIRRANLTWKEALAVDLCGRRGYTRKAPPSTPGIPWTPCRNGIALAWQKITEDELSRKFDMLSADNRVKAILYLRSLTADRDSVKALPDPIRKAGKPGRRTPHQ